MLFQFTFTNLNIYRVLQLVQKLFLKTYPYAVGQIHFANDGLIAAIVEDHPCPVSPNPCKNMI